MVTNIYALGICTIALCPSYTSMHVTQVEQFELCSCIPQVPPMLLLDPRGLPFKDWVYVD